MESYDRSGHKATRQISVLGARKEQALHCLDLLTTTLSGGDPETRVSAAQSIGQIKERLNEGINQLCLTARHDSDWEVRYAATEALGRAGLSSPRATETLLRMLETEKNPAVCQMAALSLGRLKPGSDHLPFLLGMLAGEETRRTILAITVLGMMGAPQAVPALKKALSHPDLEVRLEVVQALGQIHSPSSALALMKALDDPDDLVREEAIQSLGRIRSDHPFKQSVMY